MPLIHGMFDSGALPVAERLVHFTSQRHTVLADNIANLSTPYFKPRDLNPESFQAALREAVERRRHTVSPTRRPLPLRDTHQLTFRPNGITGRPDPTNDNILFHDENNRNVDRIMQQLAENTMAHRLGTELVRNQLDMLRLAIRERFA